MSEEFAITKEQLKNRGGETIPKGVSVKIMSSEFEIMWIDEKGNQIKISKVTPEELKR